MPTPPATEWTWRERSFVGFLGTFLLYVGSVVGGLIYTGWERMLPPQAHSAIMTTLAVSVICSLVSVIHHRHKLRGDYQFVALYALRSDAAASRPTAGVGQRIWEEPTVPTATATVYASTFAATSFGNGDALAEVIEERLSGKIKNFGEREYRRGWEEAVVSETASAPVREAFMHGYELRGQHERDNAALGPNVVPMPSIPMDRRRF